MREKLFRSFALTATLVCALTPLLLARPQASDTYIPPKFRLPADVAAPVRYGVNLQLVPDQETFGWAATIVMNIKKATPVLWLNANKLKVTKAVLQTPRGPLLARVITTPKDYVGFAFDHPVGPGEFTLRVGFRGEISRKDMQGIFQLKDGDQWYIYSQFENIGARRAFPCFDEPGFKVPWQVTVVTRPDLVVVSNAPILNETKRSDGVKIVTFAETPPLPSYLVAVAVGNFDVVDAGTTGAKNTKVQIVTPHGRASEATYAAETTPTIVNLLEKYFGIPYPYEKLDEIAIPLAG
jgi:alanyl aminopeptidase